MDDCVSLFRAKLNSVFEKLVEVAVTEITHIYQDIIQNVSVPAAGVCSRDTQTQLSALLLESRLQSAMRALHSQDGVNESTEDECVLSIKAELQDVSDGPVAVPPVPTLEGATVLDVPLQTETEGMDLSRIVQLKSEMETTSNLKNSLFQGSEDEECRSHLFPGPRIVFCTCVGEQAPQDERTLDNSSLLLLLEKEKVLNTSYTETASEMGPEPNTLIASPKEEPLELHKIEAVCVDILTEQDQADENEPLKEEPLELHKIEAVCVDILTEQDQADEKEPMEGHIKLVHICPQSEQDQGDKLGTESAFTSQKSYQSEHARVVDDLEEQSNSYSTEQHPHTVSQEELCGPSVSTEDTERNIPTILSSEAIENPLLPTTQHHIVTTHVESHGQHMPAPQVSNGQHMPAPQESNGQHMPAPERNEPTGQKRIYPIRSRRPSSSSSSLFSSPPSLTSTPEQKYLKPCSVRLAKIQCFKCIECGKVFRLERYLRRHIRFHTGERPFSCKQCNRYFALKKNLKKHNRDHNGEKLHNCKYCQKQLCSRKKLKIHIRFHTGEKPYGCNLCKKRYRKKSSLKKHMVKHSGNAQIMDQTKLNG